MKRKEAAFKNMLKQATPALEPETTWEGVCGFTGFFLSLSQLFSSNNFLIIYKQ